LIEHARCRRRHAFDVCSAAIDMPATILRLCHDDYRFLPLPLIDAIFIIDYFTLI